MTKYKWSILGLVLSMVLFLVFLISPFIKFVNEIVMIIPAEELPEEIAIELGHNPLEKHLNKYLNKDYLEWEENVPKKQVFNWVALGEFGKSFYRWNLFWIPIIVFSFMAFNYKKNKK